MTGKERILGAIRGEPVDSLPHLTITMMKAARAIGAPYGLYARDAETHARGQIAVSRKFGIDHVSGISDPAVEAADLGATVVWHDDAPPAIDEAAALLADPSHLAGLKVPDPWASPRMRKRIDVVSRLKKEAGGEKAVEGWIEGPIAESCDLRGINRIMMDFYDTPSFVHELIAFVLEVETAFARAQVEAGADFIGMGDAAASLIGPDLYREFAWEAEKKLVDAVHRMGVPVRLHICGNISALLGMLADVKADMVDLDSMVSVREARQKLGAGRFLTGNINPVSVVKDGTPKLVEESLAACFSDAGQSRYGVAAGCEIPRDTPDENLDAMRKFARAHRPA